MFRTIDFFRFISRFSSRFKFGLIVYRDFKKNNLIRFKFRKIQILFAFRNGYIRSIDIQNKNLKRYVNIEN
jgi:hypothetical protein